MKTGAEFFVDLKSQLTVRIDDPAAYLKTVRGKKLKQEFGKLTRAMLPDDQLWEWQWFGKIGVRNSYSLGWCVLRDDAVICFHCHSFS